jgi:hypothetical protein
MGFVYFGLEDLPADTTVDVTARGEEVAEEFGRLPAVIIEHNLMAGEFGQQLVGCLQDVQELQMRGRSPRSQCVSMKRALPSMH